MLTQIIWDIDPVIFQLGNFGIRYYSVLFASGFIAGYLIVKKMFIKEGIAVKELDNLLVYVLIGGLLGARLGHCFFYDWQYFSQHPLEIILPVQFQPEFRFTGFRGLASHGGAIGILVALLLFIRQSGIKSYLYILDRVAIPTALAGAFIRAGNLMNSEIYGDKTDLPWGFIFVRNGDNFASHPTQIYEAFAYIITFIVLMWLYKKRWQKQENGFFLGLFMIMVFLSRFLIEFVKNVQVGFEKGMAMNMGQILSIPFIIGGIFLLYYSMKKKKRTA